MPKKDDCGGLGKGGECVCPECKSTIPHRRGVPCRQEHCPECGKKMLRAGSEHHALWLKKKQENRLG